MTHWLSVLVVSFIYIQDNAFSLRLLEVRIPNYVTKGSKALLECFYDLEDESLYSIKWYKDGNEFYRYLPREIPSAQTYKLPGVSVDLENSSDTAVSLANVSLYSAGIFRCEVSGEAPSFQTVTDQGVMVVVSLPDQDSPHIYGGDSRYHIGDWIHKNCSARRSKPAVHLQWFINNEAADVYNVKKYETFVDALDGLETSTLGLQFRVEKQHFRNGDMKIRCVASLSNLYSRSNEESILGLRQQKTPALESRGSIYASNSRADPVPGNYTDSISHCLPSIFLLLTVSLLLSEYWLLGELKIQFCRRKHNLKSASPQFKHISANQLSFLNSVTFSKQCSQINAYFVR